MLNSDFGDKNRKEMDDLKNSFINVWEDGFWGKFTIVVSGITIFGKFVLIGFMVYDIINR